LVFTETNFKRGEQVTINDLLSQDAVQFLKQLHLRFNSKRRELLKKRGVRDFELRLGQTLDFLPETEMIRLTGWEVAPAPEDLKDRRVEITGPAEPKMIINALNSGAKVFMADFEDSLSPTIANLVEGQIALYQAVRKTLSYSPENGKEYKLQPKTATLVVRPRGLHLEESHLVFFGERISASLFDFGLYFYHNAAELLKRGSGPYFYLPKMESHREARWWNEVFEFAQSYLGIPSGSIRATCLIETINAAFEMDEILYELRDHASGLNAGRWDYIFSYIKKHHFTKDYILPDRAQVTMTAPMMQAYCELLVRTCHKRGAHAMGGMSAFIPNRREPEVTRNALEKVEQDKRRESRMGFDGTWVAHPDLVPVAQKEFDLVLGNNPDQKNVVPDISVTSWQLLNSQIPGGAVTEAGIRGNMNVALLYIDRWLSGTGAAALHNLMEDAATAEICRSQIWQWRYHQVTLSDGRLFDDDLCREWLSQEREKISSQEAPCLAEAFGVLSELVFARDFSEFLTIPCYELLIKSHERGESDDIRERVSAAATYGLMAE
jgi:malate synthase